MLECHLVAINVTDASGRKGIVKVVIQQSLDTIFTSRQFRNLAGKAGGGVVHGDHLRRLELLDVDTKERLGIGPIRTVHWLAALPLSQHYEQPAADRHIDHALRQRHLERQRLLTCAGGGRQKAGQHEQKE